MKNDRILLAVLFIAIAVLTHTGYSQMMGGERYLHPDSVSQITVTGKTIVDNSMTDPLYYLDEDGDGLADYHLNFGPHWYMPDSSAAVRPANSQTITISGGLHKTHLGNNDVIIVYEIDGLFWRDPVAPNWNYMGGHDGRDGHHNGMGFAFGWMHDSLQTIEISGKVLTDTTIYFTRFYLDSNHDDIPDYFLNFGPPWYEPSKGSSRPVDGDTVSIVAGLLNNHDIPMLIIYQINNVAWRDSISLGKHFGGGWCQRYIEQPKYFHSPFDSLDGMSVNPGWYGAMGNGHMGTMMADSLFCQILEVFPQNIPNRGNNHVMAGYEVAMFNPDGTNNMWMGGMNGGHMNFNSNVDFKMHYNDVQLMGERIDENSIKVKYWDDQTSSWKIVDNATVNASANLVSFSSNEVSNYVILTGSQSATAIDDGRDITVKGFSLKQNYPNPFNPTTSIKFELVQTAKAQLSIYNIIGQKIQTLVDDKMNAGSHVVEFNAKNLPSGIYYYKLQINGNSIVRKMTLIK